MDMGMTATDATPTAATATDTAPTADATTATGATATGATSPDAATPHAASAATATDAATANKADAGTDAAANPANPAPNPDDTPLASLASWEGFDIGLPDHVLDPAVLQSFGRAAVDMGLTPRQARALARWQTDQIAQAQARQLEAGQRELAQAWGADAQRNRDAVLGLISRIDRLTGDDAFSRALGESGAACFPGIVRGLHAVAALLAEDSTGASPGAASAPREESALDGLTNALREARRSGR